MAEDPQTPADANDDLPDAESDRPNYPRMIGLSVMFLGLVGWLFYIRVLNPVFDYDQLPGVDVSGLSGQQMHTLLDLTNKTKCGCGLKNCTMTLAECRNHDPTCHTSLVKVNAMAADMRAGRPVQVPTPGRVPDMPHAPPAPPGSPAPSAQAPSDQPSLAPSTAPSTEPSSSSSAASP